MSGFREMNPTEEELQEFDDDVDSGMSPGEAMTRLIDKCILREIFELEEKEKENNNDVS